MIVVIGATGNVGRPLVGQLLDRGAAVRALTRNPERAALPEGAQVVRADLAGAVASGSGLGPLLDGADALHLNLAATGPEAAHALVRAAVEARVGRLVLLSSSSVTDTEADESNFISKMHVTVERAIRDSGLPWVFVRAGMFATNTLEFAEQLRHGDVVRGPSDAAEVSPVHEADIAAVSAVALTDTSGGLLGTTPVVTGPASLKRSDLVRAIGTALGRELRYEELSHEEALRVMTEEQGVPRPVAEAVLE
ncbi:MULTISPECIES: SDR family oxidoreductase [Streptomycetaceae]|uniref:NAD(P)-binding domain-containing protein n=1 Tax=Streptantibioticus cattleyicolor (strain ATCC 35852 / DSM 46488 / JCM 4925 / NBRC 14057 / NRRL 8057) TaxID=1003195 RepID=F8K115_STREN|nr:NAD(P)H-binding protein [Streptantibioticus cattleyicolor]AEW94875.1 hypothetical protein SCATT_25040 [Streptantibioticus cattleyicolor NRRL 8057 = DSM 46488]MYS59491.1 NAD(P)H-binding protein [Streptomyces sp. SID5468]CCB75226.1 Predicted nucleoside-diphosphate sugar epimerase [Streptantibioticus cattleyicolor NRRL 8057 = DSM 46488]